MSLNLLSTISPRQHPHFFSKVVLRQTSLPHTFELLHEGSSLRQPPIGRLKVSPTIHSLHILHLASLAPKSYSGIGRALHEGAFRLSLEHGLEGRVTLHSTEEGVPFHQKCGFDICPLQGDSYYLMSLSDKMRQRWIDLITLLE